MPKRPQKHNEAASDQQIPCQTVQEQTFKCSNSQSHVEMYDEWLLEPEAGSPQLFVTCTVWAPGFGKLWPSSRGLLSCLCRRRGALLAPSSRALRVAVQSCPDLPKACNQRMLLKSYRDSDHDCWSLPFGASLIKRIWKI